MVNIAISRPLVASALGLLTLASAFAQEVPASKWDSFLANMSARQLGPTTMGGRIADVAVYEKEPRNFYVATASGGLWKTDNAGTSFTPVFEREGSISLGAVAVSAKDPNIVWVGTGEASSRNSVAWGDGVYRSTDGGKTWANVGLKESRQISKISIDPNNADTVYVGALGPLWGAGGDRGVFKTTDGGKTWVNVLKVDDNTGVIDLAMDPSNSKILYAAMWQRRRFAYNFISGGPGSGLYKSTDSGKTWKKLAKGLPTTTIGRIGLSIFRKNTNVVIATIENKEAGGLYRSTDKGESWTKMSSTNPRPFYFSCPRQDPLDENRIYIFATGIQVSDDQGKTFKGMNARLHPDFHAVWINPSDNNQMLVGNDGGMAQSYDRGVKWNQYQNLPIGQFYAIAFDYRKPFWVYGGLQDNGSWGYPTQSNSGGVKFTDAFMTSGGDGFHVQVDPEDWSTVYSESQGGSIDRINQVTGASRGIQPNRGNSTPPLAEGERLRFNWSTPFILSPWNSKTMYLGANKLFKSVNRGDSWRAISPDLTTNDPEKLKVGVGSVTPEDTGAERHCTIITISESPIKQGLLYVGTDDGQVQTSLDDGVSWTNITANIPDLPANTWCSRVTASKWAVGRVYATFDGHRSNDFKPYVYVSEDFGKTWSKLNTGLPDYDCVYVIREGIKNPNLLYMGSEMSLWISLDRGQNWSRFRSNGFPTIAVHDVQVHPRDMELIIGTHGRAIWTLNVSGLEQLSDDVLAKDAAVLQPSNVYNLGFMPSAQFELADSYFISRNTQPGTDIFYYLKADVADDVKITVSDITGRVVGDFTGSKKAGLNTVRWAARGRNLTAGDYRVTLKLGATEYISSVKVENTFRKDD